ncbi:MAG: SDR family NAD(P)-dependent oxidoreductase [Burkholderiales bacterium]|nr:SDR family NAD(P)-dependent oxidoreductase [Burkholderiales bacterium]
MSEAIYVITGASRGLGLAMANAVATPGVRLLTVARTASDALATHAARNGAAVEQWCTDLSDAAAVSARLAEWLAQAGHAAPPRSVTLINNAAVLPQIAPLRALAADDIARAVAVGLTATLQLSAAFLRATSAWSCPRRVLNISSGNGRRAMASQAVYSAIKAGMDHASRVIAIEEAAVANGAKVVSLAPGIVDTDMQTHLRNARPEDFPAHGQFVDYKQSGQLWTPEAAAERVLNWLDRADFGADPVADVRD